MQLPEASSWRAQAAARAKDQALAKAQGDMQALQAELQGSQAELEAGAQKRRKLRAECNERLEALQALLDEVKSFVPSFSQSCLAVADAALEDQCPVT